MMSIAQYFLLKFTHGKYGYVMGSYHINKVFVICFN